MQIKNINPLPCRVYQISSEDLYKQVASFKSFILDQKSHEKS